MTYRVETIEQSEAEIDRIFEWLSGHTPARGPALV